MARDYAKIITRIWADDDFKELGATAQRLYFQLLSQPDVSMCGVVTLAERRWSMQVADQSVDAITDDIVSLEQSRFIVVDRVTQEVLVRSYVRHDEAWRSPNGMKGIDSAVRSVLSTRLKSVCRGELLKIDTSKLSDTVNKNTGRSTRDFVRGLIRGIEEDFEAPTEGAYQDPSQAPGQGMNRVSHSTEPEPETSTEPETSPETSSCPRSQAIPDEQEPRPDIDSLLDLLDLEIQRNGNRPPKRNKTNHDAMRLLLDRDHATEEQVAYVIRWTQNDQFWKANILSAAKLREKYPQLVAKIRSEAERPTERSRTANYDQQRHQANNELYQRMTQGGDLWSNDSSTKQLGQ